MGVDRGERELEALAGHPASGPLGDDVRPDNGGRPGDRG
jgi:hypothetical protein